MVPVCTDLVPTHGRGQMSYDGDHLIDQMMGIV